MDRGEGGKPASARELARQAGLSQTTVSDMLKGDVPTEDTIRGFCDKLRVRRVPLLLAGGYFPTRDDLQWDRAAYGVHDLDETIGRLHDLMEERLRGFVRNGERLGGK